MRLPSTHLQRQKNVLAETESVERDAFLQLVRLDDLKPVKLGEKTLVGRRCFSVLRTNLVLVIHIHLLDDIGTKYSTLHSPQFSVKHVRFIENILKARFDECLKAAEAKPLSGRLRVDPASLRSHYRGTETSTSALAGATTSSRRDWSDLRRGELISGTLFDFRDTLLIMVVCLPIDVRLRSLRQPFDAARTTADPPAKACSQRWPRARHLRSGR